MKQLTLQEHYNLIKEGKGHKDMFLKAAKSQFPNIIPNAATFEQTSALLKQRSIISEAIWGVTTGRTTQPDWFSIFNENLSEVQHESSIASSQEEPVKNNDKKVSKQVEDDLDHNFDYKNLKNRDNVYGQEFLDGYYTEMKDPANADKTMDELLDLVSKNLAGDRLYYVKGGQFGVKGLGYTEEAPGLGEPKEAKGKYKSSGYGDLKENYDLKLTDKESASSTDLEDMLNDIQKKYKVNDQTLEDFLKTYDVHQEDATNPFIYIPAFEEFMGIELNEFQVNTYDPKGTGLIVVGSTKVDNNEISDVLDDLGYYGVWNAREGYWFLPEAEETLDALEMELDKEFGKRGIDARFESQVEESLNENNIIKLMDLFEGEYYEMPKKDEKKKVELKKKVKKSPIADRVKEIEEESMLNAMEGKIQALAEEIEMRENKLAMIDENEDLQEFINPVRIKEMQKEIDELKKTKEKMEKEYEKKSKGKKLKEVIDETETEDEH